MLFYFVLNICIMTCTIINNSRYIQLTVVIYSVEDIHTFESRELSLSLTLTLYLQRLPLLFVAILAPLTRI